MTLEWIEPTTVPAIHDRQIEEHGGASGGKDAGLLESALSRPKNLAVYGDPDVFDLAAAYAFGIAGNHPFVDGNKRTAYVVCVLFLRLQGVQIVATAAPRVLTFEALGKGEINEKDLAQWLREAARAAE